MAISNSPPAPAADLLPLKIKPLPHVGRRTDEEIVHTIVNPPPVTSEENVWAFWDKGYEAMPPWQKRNVLGWARMLGPNWIIRVLDLIHESPANIFNFLYGAHVPKHLNDGRTTGRYAGANTSDTIRLPCLYQHGGVWHRPPFRGPGHCTSFGLSTHYSILRTVFIEQNSQLLQVVLKTLQPRIDVYESEENITSFMERLFPKDLSNLPSLGKPFVRFTMIRTPTHTRLLMRMSHAQFDAFSRTSLVNTLASLYDGRLTPASVDFSEYIRHAKKVYRRGCDHWRKVLQDAAPTVALKFTPQPLHEDTGVIRVERTIPHFRTLEGFTPATVFNTACALLLRSLAKSDDVVFGRITSGRAGLDSEFQELIGPCNNTIPVRVRFRDATRPSDVLHQIHKQYVDSIPHETVGLDSIIRDCTDWTTSLERFPVITQHLNLEEASRAETSDGSKFDINVWDPATVDPFPWSLGLGAFPSQVGVRISVAANSKYTDRSTIGGIAESLFAIINGL